MLKTEATKVPPFAGHQAETTVGPKGKSSQDRRQKRYVTRSSDRPKMSEGRVERSTTSPLLLLSLLSLSPKNLIPHRRGAFDVPPSPLVVIPIARSQILHPSVTRVPTGEIYLGTPGCTRTSARLPRQVLILSPDPSCFTLQYSISSPPGSSPACGHPLPRSQRQSCFVQPTWTNQFDRAIIPQPPIPHPEPQSHHHLPLPPEFNDFLLADPSCRQ
jgi:hypothetical protein